MPLDPSHPLSKLSRPQLLDVAKSYRWVHTIDLGDGFVTPGLWGTGNPEIASAFDQIDFRGKSVLDIGCWDGQWSFEAERRGASRVVATDLATHRDFSDQHSFEVAALLLGSSAEYIKDLSVYDIERISETFDIILYMGIYYHLKDPVLSFTKLRLMMKDGGRIIVEGAVTLEVGCFAKFFYINTFCGDKSNWWVPTIDCLREWVECSFMRVEWEGKTWGHENNQRHCLVAQSVRGSDNLYAFAPEALEDFHR